MPKSQRASVPTSVALVALGATASSGCAPLSPPPLFARHFGAAPDPKGTVVIALCAGIGGADLGGGFGLELRASWQATEGLALGVAAGGASGGDTSGKDGNDDDAIAPPTRLFALRGFGRAGSPSMDWLAGTFGAGLSIASGGLVAVTADAGGVTSAEIADRIEPSLGLSAAVSLPVRQGRGLAKDGDVVLPTPSFYLGGSAGLGVRLGDSDNVVSAELGGWRALATSGARATVYSLSLADAQGIRP